MSDDAFERLLASLPTPGIDKLPPRVEMSAKDRQRAKEDRKDEDGLLDPKNDTETRVKYALGSLCGMRLRKDGDYETIAGGIQVWRKKIADYVGSTPGMAKNYHTYVEVKGVSPGNRFMFSRLDVPNKEGQPSQHEKLSKELDNNNLVFLAIGWWIARPGVEPVKLKKKSKTYTKWRKEELELEITFIPWGTWLEFYNGTKRRSMTKTTCDKEFSDCRIMKSGTRWKMISHWWNNRYNDGLFSERG